MSGLVIKIQYHKTGIVSTLRRLLCDWCPHHDSNVELLLRTELFYPLNYGGICGLCSSPLRYLLLNFFQMCKVAVSWFIVHHFTFAEPVSNFFIGL